MLWTMQKEVVLSYVLKVNHISRYEFFENVLIEVVCNIDQVPLPGNPLQPLTNLGGDRNKQLIILLIL
jgi:hypothetical protein